MSRGVGGPQYGPAFFALIDSYASNIARLKILISLHWLRATGRQRVILVGPKFSSGFSKTLRCRPSLSSPPVCTSGPERPGQARLKAEWRKNEVSCAGILLQGIRRYRPC